MPMTVSRGRWATRFCCCEAAFSGERALQSRLELHPIVAVHGAIPSRAWRPPLDEQREAVCPRPPDVRPIAAACFRWMS